MPDRAREELSAGLDMLGLSSVGALPERLLAYVALLAKWNRAYNLTAVRDRQEMVLRHLLDSLSVLPWVVGPRLLDMGSGGGLPGIPLALACPELDVVLLDSNLKKSRFQRQAVIELPLSNVAVVEMRAEDYRPDAGFDTVVSRAFSSLLEFLRLGRPLLAPGGRLLAMKGHIDEKEVAQTERERVKLRVHELRVPGLDAERHLVEISLAD
jgi:16S rRNA (guanine527-N7)-methyltransferase